jgi:hypothetical protein
LGGPNPFISIPSWNIDNDTLKVVPSLKYLGSIINGGNHVDVRKQAAQRAFYSLQGAGIKYGGVSPVTAMNIYDAAVSSVLSYCCGSVHLSNSKLKELDKTQSKHVKVIMGLKFSSHTTVLLERRSVTPISIVIKSHALRILKSCLASNSIAKNFYVQLMKKQFDLDISKTLLGRVNSFLSVNNISLPSIFYVMMIIYVRDSLLFLTVLMALLTVSEL